MSHGPSDVNPNASQYGEFVATRQLAANGCSIIYRARKQDHPAQEKYEQYVLVVFRPAKEELLPGTEKDNPTSSIPVEDLQARFIEGVYIQKKALESGVPNIVPIRAFASTPQQAWYVSDYYARGFLKKWISQRAGVTEEELRHIIFSIVQTLGALKRIFKRTHGRLSPSAILIGGKVGTPLREAPIDLTFLPPGSEKEAKEFELSDLKAIGQIILQLVCRDEMSSFNTDYYPIPPSEHWMQLGKKGEYWRGLCNRLLDPQLPSGGITVESLAGELKPKRKAPVIALMTALVVLSGLAVLFYIKRPFQHPGPQTQRSADTVSVLSTNPTPVAVTQDKSNQMAIDQAPTKPEITTPIVSPPPNTPPIISVITNQVVESGQPVSPIHFTVNDNETEPSRLNVQIKSLSPSLIPDSSISLEGTGSNRTITIRAQACPPGIVPLVLWVNDGNLSVTNVFMVMVKPPYHPPELKGLQDQTVKLGTRTVRIPFQVTENEAAAEGLYVGIASSNPGFLPHSSIKVEGSGAKRVLVVDPVPQQAGQAIFAISVSDARTNVTESFWFKVAP